MKKTLAKLTPFDVVDYLDSEETIESYMDEARSCNDPEFLLVAQETVRRARARYRLPDHTQRTTT